MTWNNTYDKLPLDLAKCERKLKNGTDEITSRPVMLLLKSGDEVFVINAVLIATLENNKVFAEWFEVKDIFAKDGKMICGDISPLSVLPEILGEIDLQEYDLYNIHKNTSDQVLYWRYLPNPPEFKDFYRILRDEL